MAQDAPGTRAVRGEAELPPSLPTEFYTRSADLVAPELLGKLLVVRRGEEALCGRIVETEAYLGETDLACHAARGYTPRTSTLYGPAGTAYVYLIYGMYDMFNAVCQPEGVPHAVLVRAVELLRAPAGARGDGPGRLSRALGITRADNGESLAAPPVSIHDAVPVTAVEVTRRVGVGYAGVWADAPLRFLDAGSNGVSRPTRSSIGSGPKPSR